MTFRKIQNPLSLWVLAGVFLIVLIFRSLLLPANILSWDTFGYYLYLPAFFIYRDPLLLDLSWVSHIMEQYPVSGTLYQVHEAAGGAHLIRYTSGMALIYLPFFLIGHLAAVLLGFPADGFSAPYQYAIALEGLLLLFAGLLVLRRFLLRYFPDRVVALSLGMLVMGTNLLEMAYNNAHLPHGILFAAYATLLLGVHNWHTSGKFKYLAGIALLCGWAALARPTEILALFLPILYGIYDRQSLQKKWTFLWKQRYLILLAIPIFCIPLLPQLYYWKSVTGTFIHYSYQNPAEGLDFLSPHTLPFLFSFRKGWLIYTPMMLFALAGIFVLFRRNREYLPAVFIFTIAYVYVCSSWTCWWYGHSFGQRSMVQAYAVLALPFTSAWMFILGMPGWKRNLLLSLAVFFLLLNVFQSWQYSFARILDGSRMTVDYYERTFFRLSADEEDRNLLLVERSTGEREVLRDTLLYTSRPLMPPGWPVPGPNISRIDSIPALAADYQFFIDSANPFTIPIRAAFEDITFSDHAWIRVSAEVFPLTAPEVSPFSLVMAFEHGAGKTYNYRAWNFESSEYQLYAGQWNSVQADYLTPEVRSVRDTWVCYWWQRGREAVYIRNVQLMVFERKDQR